MKMRLNKTAWAVLIFIFLAALLFFNKNNSTSKIVDSCKNSNYKQIKCIEDKILTETDKDPKQTGALLKSLWLSKDQSLDLRAFSPLAHQVGMSLAGKPIDLSEAIIDCGQSFKDACVHGVIMEYIDKHFFVSKTEPKFLHLCNSLKAQVNQRQYKDCVHAIGHELRAKILGTNNQVLIWCSNFSGFFSACAGGVFMEASKGNNGIGYHSDEPVGRAAINCNQIPSIYKHACYFSIGSYRQYEVRAELWKETFRLCSYAPVLYKNDCYGGIDERLLMSKGGSQEAASNFCLSLEPTEQPGCLLVKQMDLESLE